MSLKNFKNRYKIWKVWRINNRNSKFHQWLVLFKLKPSPTFDTFEAWYYIKEGFKMWKIVWPDEEENNKSTKDLKFNHDPVAHNVLGKVDSIDCSDDGIKITVSEAKDGEKTKI